MSYFHKSSICFQYSGSEEVYTVLPSYFLQSIKNTVNLSYPAFITAKICTGNYGNIYFLINTNRICEIVNCFEIGV